MYHLMNVKIKYTLVVVSIILIIFFIFYIKTLLNPKSCKSDNDCVTSCGQITGRGNSYNKNYLKFRLNQPPDNTCCFCENCQQCVISKCVDNTCTAVRTDGNCC